MSSWEDQGGDDGLDSLLPPRYIGGMRNVSGSCWGRQALRVKCVVLWGVIALFLPLLHPGDASASSGSERRRFQSSIIDHRKKLNRNFRRISRKKTEYIIVHTSEGGLNSALRVISNGKIVRGKRITPGGHAHYVIARNGKTYRTLDRKYVADHAGESIWDGVPDISKVSVSIELVGYHSQEIASQQYRSLGLLLEILQSLYDLEDRQVLTHSQVAYGKPNRWIREDHRGRKRCARNFDRAKAGLGAGWGFDPDVRSGRLVADAELANIYYRGDTCETSPVKTIGTGLTAWKLAGSAYKAPTTIYIFPDGAVKTGHQISDWDDLPADTRLIVGYRGPFRIARDTPPIGIAGDRYDDRDTVYLFPDSSLRTGNSIGSFRTLPQGVSIFLSVDES